MCTWSPTLDIILVSIISGSSWRFRVNGRVDYGAKVLWWGTGDMAGENMACLGQTWLEIHNLQPHFWYRPDRYELS